MTRVGEHAGLLRGRGDGGQRVASMELFFDLVYVFAITQLSHLLLTHLTWAGAGRTLMLLLAVWWAWVYTAWATNWFDPGHRAVRLMLVGVMLASLVMSAALPGAFGEHGLAFALAYVTIQVGRNVWVSWAAGPDSGLRRNLQRVLAWSVFAAVPWIAGGLVHGSARELLWIIAIAVDYAGPVLYFATPGLGRSTIAEWSIAGGHLAERCQLFLIVAFGESILVTGATLSGLPFSAGTLGAVAVALLGSVALWWIYFDRSAEAGGDMIATSADPGRLGRSAYTYLHLPMVAGVIVTAVGDELVIVHPTGHTGATTVATVLGGPALFLAGHALFKYAMWRRVSLPRLAALVALAGLVPVGFIVPPVALAGAATLVIAAVAVADGAHRGSGGPRRY